MGDSASLYGIRGPGPSPPPQKTQEGAYSPFTSAQGSSPFRFLITVSAKALSKHQLRSSCYLHRGLPTHPLLELSPFQERPSRCRFHTCLKETFFLNFLLHPILPSVSQKASSKEHWQPRERGWGILPRSSHPCSHPGLAVSPRFPPREHMERGGVGGLGGGPGTQSLQRWPRF